MDHVTPIRWPLGKNQMPYFGTSRYKSIIVYLKLGYPQTLVVFHHCPNQIAILGLPANFLDKAQRIPVLASVHSHFNWFRSHVNLHGCCFTIYMGYINIRMFVTQVSISGEIPLSKGTTQTGCFLTLEIRFSQIPKNWISRELFESMNSSKVWNALIYGKATFLDILRAKAELNCQIAMQRLLRLSTGDKSNSLTLFPIWGPRVALHWVLQGLIT